MYEKAWLAFVNIGAMDGYDFNDLIDHDHAVEDLPYVGAWANILIVADTINEVLDLLPKGLKELNFKVIFIDKIENLETPIENNEVNQDVIEEVNGLLASKFVFKISDRVFSYR